MPLTGFGTYLPTCDQVLAHWEALEEKEGPLVLADGFTRADLAARRTAMARLLDEETGVRVEATVLRGQVADARAALRERLLEFNRRVRAEFTGEAFAEVLAEAPHVDAGEGPLAAALRGCSALWRAIDAAGTPLVLRGAYGRAAFDAARAAWAALLEELSAATVAGRLVRARRATFFKETADRLVAYRAKVVAEFAPESVWAGSFPRLWPLPGHTPAAVAVQAGWEGTAARLTWEPSAEETLECYEVRGMAGDEWDGGAEELLGRVAAGQPCEFSTARWLARPGEAAAFKVYVVLRTGNEKGSAAVVVRRD